MQILVTGAAGFIGSHLVDRLLVEGHQVLGIDNLRVGNKRNLEGAFKNPNFQFVEADVRDYEALYSNCSRAEIVLHLAAMADIVPSIENPDEYFQSNVDGTYNVMKLARQIEAKKVIYIASSSCYGIPDEYPTPESAPIQAKYPYALTKYLGECIAMHWSAVYKIPTISLRLFNVYGPRARTSGTYGAVFGVFLAQKIANKPFTVVGDGNQTRDFTFVTDVVEAIIASMKSDKQGIYNVGSGNTYSVNRLVELLKGEVVYIPKRPGEPDCTFADTTKIQHELDWHPKVSLEKGVEEMLKNLSYWADAPLWDPQSIDIATKNWFRYLGN